MGRMGRTRLFGQPAHFSLSRSNRIASPGRSIQILSNPASGTAFTCLEPFFSTSVGEMCTDDCWTKCLHETSPFPLLELGGREACQFLLFALLVLSALSESTKLEDKRLRHSSGLWWSGASLCWLTFGYRLTGILKSKTHNFKSAITCFRAALSPCGNLWRGEFKDQEWPEWAAYKLSGNYPAISN